MHVGIIVFPGATCEHDTAKWLRRRNHVVTFISHRESHLAGKQYDLLIIPGGYAFGDRVYEKATREFVMNPGAQALHSPIMNALHGEIGYTPILGICNGFQILVHAGFLPGKLERNEQETFYCDEVDCTFENTSILGGPLSYVVPTIPIPVAHGYGRYRVTEEEYKKLKNRRQIFLTYDENVNGSDYGIAGISNSSHNVWGLMPHPERSQYADLLLTEVETYVRDIF